MRERMPKRYRVNDKFVWHNSPLLTLFRQRDCALSLKTAADRVLLRAVSLHAVGALCGEKFCLGRTA